MALGVLIACLAQILLKTAAARQSGFGLKSYLNIRVAGAYAMLVVSSLCSVAAYRALPLTVSPLFCAFEQIAVVLLSMLLLKERPSKRKIIGVGVIVLGMIIFLL